MTPNAGWPHLAELRRLVIGTVGPPALLRTALDRLERVDADPTEALERMRCSRNRSEYESLWLERPAVDADLAHGAAIVEAAEDAWP